MPTFVIRDLATGAFMRHPRNDGKPATGLDPGLVVYEVLQQEMPTEFDPTTHHVVRGEDVIDETARTVTRVWSIVEIPPPVEDTTSWRSVDKTALFLELSSRGLFATLEAIVASITDPQVKEEAQIWMRYAITANRDHNVVLGLAQQLNMDASTMDEVFQAAKVRETTMADATLNLIPETAP